MSFGLPTILYMTVPAIITALFVIYMKEGLIFKKIMMFLTALFLLSSTTMMLNLEKINNNNSEIISVLEWHGLFLSIGFFVLLFKEIFWMLKTTVMGMKI